MPVLGAFSVGVHPKSMHGSFYYRGWLPFEELHKRTDWHVVWTQSVKAHKDGHFVVTTNDGVTHHPDVMWLQMYRVEGAVDHVRRAQATGQKVIADFDDDWTRIPKANVTGRDLYPGTRQALLDSVPAYDAVICSTAPLARRMRNERVQVIRNALDPSRYRFHDPAQGLYSWVGSTPWRAHDLEVLAAADLDGWLERNGQAFYNAGAVVRPKLSEKADSAAWGLGMRYSDDPTSVPPQAHELAGVDPTRAFLSPLQSLASGRYWELWDRVGVSLIPLEHCQFNTSKSWLKALESCAAGVPFIVSAGFAEQELLIQDGACGLLARNDRPKEWRASLDRLLDLEYRREAGAINREVAQRHDIADKWVQWYDVLADLIRGSTDVPRGSSTPVDPQ